MKSPRLPHFSPARAASLALALLAAHALLLSHASAATWTWDGSTSANPVATANWVGGVVPTWAADDDLYFRTVTTGNFTMTLMADRTVRSLTFGTNSTNDFKVSLNNTNGNTAYNLTMGNATNAATITLNATGGNVTIGSGIGSTFGNIILANNLTVNQNSTSGLLTIDRSISGGSYGVTKNGAGALTLSGAANTWNGTTSITAGTVNLSGTLTTAGGVYVNGATGPILNITGNLTSSNAGGARALQIAATAGNTGTVNVSGSGVLNLTGGGMMLGENNGGNGTFNQTGGTVTLAGSTTWMAGANSTMNISGGNFSTGSNAFYIAGGTGANTVSTLTVNGTGIARLGSLQVGQGSTGAGAVSAINIGDGTVGGGELVLGGLTYGNANVTQTINFNGGTFTANANSMTINSSYTSVVKSGGAIFNVNPTYTLTVSGNLTNGGGGGLTKNGTGTLLLTGTNTYNGVTTINAGTLQIGNNGTTGSLASTTIVNNANLVYDLVSDGSTTVVLPSGITGTGNLTVSGGRIQFGGNITQGGNMTFTQKGYSGGGTWPNSIRMTASSTLTASSITMNGLIGQDGANTYNMTLDTSASNGPINLNLSVAQSGRYYDINAFTANAGTGTLNFAGSPSMWGVGTTSLTGALNVSASFSPSTLHLNATGNSSVTGAITLRTDTVNNWTVSPSVTMTVSGVLAGSNASITKNGTGTLTLSGNNTYTGATTVNAGTLQIGAGGATGALSASSAITNNGTLTFNRTDTVTQGTQFGSVIAGTGNLTQAGTGTLILSGNNTYTGATRINAGTLQIGAGGAAGALSASSAITNNGTLTFNRTDTVTQGTHFASVIAGTGNLIQAGSGVLTLSGNNTYTGTTTIINGGADYSAGNQLRLSNASGPAILGNVTIGNNSGTNAGAMLVTTQNNQLGSTSVITINNTSSGYGYFELRGTAQTIAGLSGAASARTVVQNQESGTLASAATLTINNTNNFTYGGIIRDAYFGSVAPLSIIKNGSGTQTFSGNNSYTGMTTINAGTLSLGGSSNSTIGGSVTIAGGELNYSSVTDDQIANTANITMSSGALTMGARAETINSLALSGGNLTIGSGTLSLAAASSFTGGNVSMTSVSSRINTTGTSTLGNTTFSYNNASDATSGIILAGDFLVNASSTANFNNAAAGAGRINLGSANRVFDVGTGSNMNVGWYLDSTNASGALTKNGSGTLTLSGNNTYTGTTTINGGTLQVSGSGLLGGGTYAGNIANGGAFLYNGTNSQTLSGVISGSGDLTKSNSGTLALSGNNTYTGATTVNAGTLQIGAGGTSGSLSTSSAITNNSHIVFNRTDTVTQGTDFANSITGSGNITQSGSGTLVLGTNTYSGATTVNAGTLQLSGNLSSSALTVAAGGIISVGDTTAAAKSSASSITLQGGSGYAFTIANVNAFVAGTDYDQLATAGALTLTNTAANPFTIYISGTPAGWNNSGNYNWDIISAGSITGFSAGNFTWNFDNFGIASGDRTGTWDISNPSGGIIRLSYTEATPNYYWSGASGNWSTGFTPSQPITDKNLFFIGGVGGTATNNIASGTLSSLNFITFNSTAGSYTLAANAGSAGASGGTALTVKGDITNYSANAQTINMDLALLSSSTGIFNTAAGNMTIGGVVSGAGVLTKQGSRTLVLGANNTYTGATIISGGTLQIGAGGTSGALNANSTITNNGTLAFNRSNTVTQGTDFAGVLTGAGNITQAGSGTLLLTGNNTYTGTTTLSAGTLEVGAAGRLGGGAYAGNIANNGTLIYSGSNAQTLSGVISGSGALTQNNSSSTLTLSGNNTYTGATTISAGTLLISSAGRLGGGNYTANISNTGTFLYNGTNAQTLSGVISGTGAITKNNTSTLTLAGSNTYNGAITINAGTLQVGSTGLLGGGSYSGNIAINGASTSFLYSGTSSQTISGAVSGNGAFTMNGTGTLTFSGAKSYTGGTTVNAGTLSINAGAITGNITVNSGARLTTANHNMFSGVGNLTVNGGTLDLSVYQQGSGPSVANFIDATITGGGGMLRGVPTYNFSGNNTWSNSYMDLLTAPTINVTSGTTTLASAFAIANGNANVTKAGNGTLVLSAANTYTSTTILNAGTLAINNATAIGNGTLTIAGGTLDNTSAAAITLTNNNTQNWNGDFTFAGTRDLNMGTGNVTMNASRTVTVNSGTLTVGNMRGVGYSLTKNGSGTLTISSQGSGLWTGNTTVNSGTLHEIVTVNAAGISSSNKFINNGSTMILSQNTGSQFSINDLNVTMDATGGATLTLGGTGSIANIIINAGKYVTIRTLGGAQNVLNTTVGGYFNSQGGAGQGVIFDVAAGSSPVDLLVNVNVQFNGGTITKNGTGTVSINASTTNSGNGPMTINAGTLVVSGAAQLASGTFSSNIINNGTFSYNSTSNQAISGNITGTGAITKNNTSTLTLTGVANTYNGSTTVNSGTLQLGGNITSSALTVNSGGVISVGTSSTITTINKVNAASITLNGGSGYALTIGNVTSSVAGTDYDQLTATGALTFNNTAANPFTIYLNGTPTGWSNSGNYSWTIISAASQTGFSSGNLTLDFNSFGIAGSSRTGTWAFTNPSGGNITLAYSAPTVADAIWSGGSGNWSAGFTPSGVATDANIFFTGAGGTATNDIASGTLSSVNFITFNSTAGAYTLNATTGAAGLAGGTPLTVKGDIINNANSTQTIDMNLALLPTSTGIINAVNGNMSAQTYSSNITISGNISGAGGIIKQGNGSLTLSGANTYNGTTTITSGAVFITSNTALGSTAAGTSINGGRLILNGNGLNISENITVNSDPGLGGIQSWNGNNTISGLITLNAYHDIRGNGVGTLTLAGGVTSPSNQSLNFATSTIFNTTPITIGTGFLGFQGGSNQINVAGNTFSSLNLGWGGTLTLGVSNAIASTANVTFGGTSLANNAFTLSLNGTNQTISGLFQSGSWNATDGQDQNITGGGVLTVNQTSNATRSYGGRITDGATPTSLVKNGNGTLMLQNWSGINSSYSGATTINAGTLMILAGNGTSLSANSSYTVASGAVLTLGGNSTVAGPATAIIGSLAGAGTVQNGNASTAITLTAGGNNATTTFSGVLQNGGAAALALTKNGTGTLTLSGNNTYSGNTTVNAGTLGLDGRLSGNTAITIAGSGALTQSSTGVISGTSSFTHNSSGTSTLAGNNTYSGTTTVSAGTLTLSGANTGGGAVVIDSVLNIQGNLTFAGNNQMTVGNALNGTVNHSAGTVTFAAGNNLQLLIGNAVTATGNYNLSGNGVLSIGASSNRGIMIGVNSGTAGNLANSAFNMSGGTITNSSDLMIGRHDWTTSYMNATYSQTGGNATHTNLKLGGSAGNGANSNVFLTLTGGNFTATNFTSLAAGNSVNATITIGGNAVVNLPAFATTRGTGSNAYLIFDGGTLRPTASSSAYLGGLTSATIRSGGATFDTNGNNITVSQALLANATSTGGGLTKNGTGTLTLTGNNTYTGTTTINAGTIEIGAAGLLGGGSYSGNIANSGLLIYSGTNNQILSGILSGNGALTQNNTGTLTLSGANTYTGTTTINAGTLAIGANMTIGAFTGTGNLSLGTGYTLTTNTSTANTFSGALIGSGGLTKNGTSTLTLGGNNTYAGATTINAGTLEIGAAGRLGGGTYAGNIANTATFLYSGTNNQILSGILSGNGSFAQNAASTLTLTGNNTYTGATTIYDGTIEIGATGRLGGGNYAGNIANTGVLIYSGTNDQTLSGVISSVGALTHNASSTLTLSGNNTYSGGTTLNTGTLVIGNANAAGTGTITQASSSSLLKIDTTGTITNAMSVYNVLASQSATLSGAITVNNATWDIDTGDTLTISGAVSGNGGVTKNGGGTLILSGNNTYLAPTVINAGTLNAASVNALGSNNTVTVNGGSLLVTADDAINGMTVTLNSTSTTVAGLAFNGTYSGLVDNLTLSKNSIIDLGEGSVSIMFDTFVMNSYTLDIYNWTGTTLWNGGTGNDTDKVYFGPDLSDAALAKIYFHSGAVGGGDSFLGSGYDLGLQQTSWDSGLEGYHIIPVPEPETYATGLLLLLGSAWWMWRKRSVFTT